MTGPSKTSFFYAHTALGARSVGYLYVKENKNWPDSMTRRVDENADLKTSNISSTGFWGSTVINCAVIARMSMGR